MTVPQPSAAFVPLQPRTLWWQLVLLVGAEVLLYSSYSAHDARFHWATHFLVGLTVASLWQAGFLLVAARPARLQLLPVLGFHLWAMWPDLVFRAPGIPHYRWMDAAALGHVSSHYVPGGDLTWLLVAVLTAGAYALLLCRWLLARDAEVAAGMEPAIAVGGTAVWRPQHDPRQAVLGHEVVGPAAGLRDGAPVFVLLHGLGGTGATWLPTAQRLADAGRTALVPDLLGFGSSMRIGTRFGLDEQAGAVLRLLDHTGAVAVHLVAHSWGSTVAAAVAARAPGRVVAMTLVAPAVFSDGDAARERLSGRSSLARLTLSGSPLGGFACGLMCLTRPLLVRLVPRIASDLRAGVARGGVQHSYAAYSDALSSMFDDNPVGPLLRDPPCPVTVVLADDDETVHAGDVLDLPPAQDVRVVRVPGDHAVVYDDPDRMADLLLSQVGPTPT